MLEITSGFQHRSGALFTTAWVRVESSQIRAKTQPVPLRDLCLLMRHDMNTHLKHYGSWSSNEDVKESVLRAVGDLQKLKDTGLY